MLAPGSPTDTPAYALERHDDGSVTLTIEDLALDSEGQADLAGRLKAEGITVSSDTLKEGYRCRSPRGTSLPGSFTPDHGSSPRDGKTGTRAVERDLVRSAAVAGTWKVTLRRGDSLAFENQEPVKGKGRTGMFYAVRGELAPCVPVPVEQPATEPTGSPDIRTAK
ncbi:hypothetical protein V2W30_21490 [Streptomyces sp. Q6]|uniref:Uncharacterized protein n=1 Tax=Streptomyces citrinus TaxID=3118173 RepID=A0ACD5AIF7_9ACTN